MIMCQLYIRELVATVLECWLKFVAIDVCFRWVRIRPVEHWSMKIYGSPEFVLSLTNTIKRIDSIDRLSGERIRHALKYIAEGIGNDDIVLLRSQGVLIGTQTNKRGCRAIAHLLVNASVSCRIYSGFHVWTSRMDETKAKRVRQLSLHAQRRLFNLNIL